MKLEAIIKNIAFLGERYEITAKLESGAEWLIYHNKKLNIEDKINLYFNNDSMIKINN